MYQATKQRPIERLFLRLASLYGKHWIDMWSDVPIDSVMDEWQSKLSGLSSKVVFGAVDYCAENMKYPPTLPEFLQICKAKTPQEVTKVLERKFTEDELLANKKRIEKISKEMQKNRTDFRAWIVPILANPKSYPDISVKYATEVKEAVA